MNEEHMERVRERNIKKAKETNTEELQKCVEEAKELTNLLKPIIIKLNQEMAVNKEKGRLEVIVVLAALVQTFADDFDDAYHCVNALKEFIAVGEGELNKE